MSTIAQFSDIPPILNAALAAGGAQYVCENKNAAIFWRARAYKYRKLLRDLEAQRYAHVQGYSITTPYDTLVLRINKQDPSIIDIGFAEGPGKLRDMSGKPLAPMHTGPSLSDLEEEAEQVAKDLGLEI